MYLCRRRRGDALRSRPHRRGSLSKYDFPNYHYVRFELHEGKLKGEMIRLEDHAAPGRRSGKAEIASRSGPAA